MLSRVYCACCRGLQVTTVTVEVDISDGICFYLVGLADSAVKESQQRINSALNKYGFKIPGKRIVINLAPANIRKEGSAFDVAIAIGIICASQQMEFDMLNDFLIMGELSLDGTLRHITGALPIIIHARDAGFKACILPKESAYEGAEIEGITIFAAENIKEVIDILSSPDTSCNKIVQSIKHIRKNEWDYDFANVRGQLVAKKGLEIAAAGGHNLIMIGSPGSGKTFMAKCLPSILPQMEKEEAIETSKIYSVAGLLNTNKGLIWERPFRQPHHTSTIQALAGAMGMPGEVSLAHNGVFFADEFAEFTRASLEILRQPLEDREIQICRAKTRITYPASFMLIAAMNPCPCGYYGDPNKNCNCSASSIIKYNNKISGPLMDRIDIQLNIRPVSPSEIVGRDTDKCEDSKTIAERVKKARDIQFKRYKGENFYTNAQIPPGKINKYCPIGEPERDFLQKNIEKLNISARGYSRILKISRTIADLDGQDFISLAHISKAIQFKLKINEF